MPGINDNAFHLAFMLNVFSIGLADGAVYALLALAIAVIYRTTGHLNFAQGEIAMLSTFLAYSLMRAGLPIWLAVVASVALSAAGAAVLYMAIIGPLDRRGPNAVVIATLGLFLALNATGGEVWGVQGEPALQPFPNGVHDKFLVMRGRPVFYLTYSTIGSWVVLAIVVILLWVLLMRTKFGLAYRAVSSNRESAALAGVPIGVMMLGGWALSTVPGTLAGVETSQLTSTINYNMMFSVLVFAFAAVSLGGFESLPGAAIGGLLVGLIVAVIPNIFTFVGGDLGLVLALAVILIVLLIRPAGLFGLKRVQRV